MARSVRVHSLLAMRAAADLARTAPISDASFAAACDAAFDAGSAAMESKLWNASAGYFRSYVGGHAIMADALYAQVLADTLGLGALVSDEQVLRHVQARGCIADTHCLRHATTTTCRLRHATIRCVTLRCAITRLLRNVTHQCLRLAHPHRT